MDKEELKKLLMEHLTIECTRGWRQGDKTITIKFDDDDICECNVNAD